MSLRVAVSGDNGMKNLFLVFALLSLGGCASEVDKCVAEWEKANPGLDDGGDYCSPEERDYNSGECRPNYKRTRAQARVAIRMDCLRATRGT